MAASEDTALIPAKEDARRAFEGGDVDASRKFHDDRHQNEGWHQGEGGLLKPVIFGGLDGILTSFAIVAGGTFAIASLLVWLQIFLVFSVFRLRSLRCLLFCLFLLLFISCSCLIFLEAKIVLTDDFFLLIGLTLV